MGRLHTHLALVIVALLILSASAFAGPLDDYYLQQFGEAKSVQLQKAILSAAPATQEAAKCGMPLKHGLRRDWNQLEQTTQKVLAKQLALPTLSGTEQTVLSSKGHFKVHYSNSGADAPNIYMINQYSGLSLTSAADWANRVAATFEEVYAKYSSLGYQPAPTASGGAYDLYLRDLAPQGYYGVAQSGDPVSSSLYPNSFSSWMELDNDFTEAIYKPNLYSPLQSLQITAAHEYHHAVQYGYTFYFDVWYAEATSSWMEDEVYDDVNQLYNYIQPWFSNSSRQINLAQSDPAFDSQAYGRWIFNRYLVEMHGVDMIKTVWEKTGAIQSVGADIPMIPVLESVLSLPAYNATLSSDYFGFTKRVYTKEWTTHTYDKNLIHPYLPVAYFAVHPASSSVTTMTPSIALPHFSFAYYKFTPATGLTSMKIFVSRDNGIQTALFKNGNEIAPEAGGISFVVNGLGTSDEVVLLVANSSNMDNLTASFGTNDGSKIEVTSGTASPAKLTSGNGNGCFIATAAYGSYLHPQVQLLRDFRDRQLLTNAPGRAFVAFYYRCSPPLADFISRHHVLRSMTRLVLTPLVAAIAHPLISALSLFLLVGAVLMNQLRRVRADKLFASQIPE